MVENLSTRGQLERELSQKIQAFYRHHLGHQPSKVTCQIFNEKLVIILEDSITTAEQLLLQEGKEDLAGEVRSNLDEAIQPELKQVINEILNVEVIDILSDATLDTGRTGIIAVLAETPKMRNSNSQLKFKTRQ